MKKLKLKILLTNMSRIVRSIFFINLSNIVLGMNKVFGAIDINTIKVGDVSCYSAEMTVKEQIRYFLQENIFILLVPIVLIVITIILAAKRIKENRKINEEAERRIEENKKGIENDKQD